jgi:hypothetical protein
MMRCHHPKNPNRDKFGSCDGQACYRKLPIPEGMKCCFQKTDESKMIKGIVPGAVRVCVTCGLVAYTEKDLELFKKHSKNDPNYKYYPYGVDAQCLECHRKQDNEWRKQVRKEDPQRFRKIAHESFMKFPERYHAVSMANYYLETGSKCEHCGTTEKLRKHHPDYNKPLEVVTLCAPCHRKLHIALKRNKEMQI